MRNSRFVRTKRHTMDEHMEHCGISQPCISSAQMHDDIKLALDLQSEKYIHSTQMLKTNRCLSNKSELFNSKLKDQPKPLFNLQLPANGYINDDLIKIDNECLIEPFCRVQDVSSSKRDKETDIHVTNSIDEVGCSNYSYAYDEKAWDANGGHGENHAWPDGNSTLAIESRCNDLPYLDFNNSALTSSLFGRSPPFSTLKNRPEIEYIPIVIQALPCFPKSYRLKTRNMKSSASNNTDKLVIEEANIGEAKKVKIRIKKPKHSKYSADASVFENSTISKPGKFPRRTEANLGIHLPSYETVDSLAADVLVDMSVSSTAPNIGPSSCDSLNWLVNVISSELPSDDWDRFETLTLKLEEMKQEEYNNSVTKMSANDNLVTKKCKKHARKFRKKKNFQRDVLPSIVPLSRQEVKEDFRAFDCLMRSIGETLNSKLLNNKRKRKKNTESKKQDKSLTGWGKKTRRGPRTRVKLGNITLVF